MQIYGLWISMSNLPLSFNSFLLNHAVMKLQKSDYEPSLVPQHLCQRKHYDSEIIGEILQSLNSTKQDLLYSRNYTNNGQKNKKSPDYFIFFLPEDLACIRPQSYDNNFGVSPV